LLSKLDADPRTAGLRTASNAFAKQAADVNRDRRRTDDRVFMQSGLRALGSMALMAMGAPAGTETAGGGGLGALNSFDTGAMASSLGSNAAATGATVGGQLLNSWGVQTPGQFLTQIGVPQAAQGTVLNAAQQLLTSGSINPQSLLMGGLNNVVNSQAIAVLKNMGITDPLQQKAAIEAATQLIRTGQYNPAGTLNLIGNQLTGGGLNLARNVQRTVRG
jgi:hypothetical protein